MKVPVSKGCSIPQRSIASMGCIQHLHLSTFTCFPHHKCAQPWDTFFLRTKVFKRTKFWGPPFFLKEAKGFSALLTQKAHISTFPTNKQSEPEAGPSGQLDQTSKMASFKRFSFTFWLCSSHDMFFRSILQAQHRTSGLYPLKTPKVTQGTNSPFFQNNNKIKVGAGPSGEAGQISKMTSLKRFSFTFWLCSSHDTL